ncbi:MAG: hypothetical protein Q9168_005305 [Polycauliona sp. 1 TL-2023]
MDMSDMKFLELIRQSYDASKSRIQRLLAMRGVKKITFVKFMHATWAPDIHESGNPSGDRPPKDRCPPWDYEGCKSEEPLTVGHNYLLHRWRHPTHSDWRTYISYPRSLAERIRFILRKIGNLAAGLRFKVQTKIISSIELATGIPMEAVAPPVAPNDHGQAHDEEAAQAQETANQGSELEVETPDPSCYIFPRTPKKLGERLVANDRVTPEGWGLYFEEGFLLHHFFLIALVVYIMATAAFGAYWCIKFGLVGPESGVAAWAIPSWMIGFVSLGTTVMFKWAE